MEELILNFFFVEGGQVVIYDANNGSAKHRRNTLRKFEERGVHVIFLGASEAQRGKGLMTRVAMRQGGYH